MLMCCLYVVYGHLSSSACMSMSSDGLIHSAVGISQHKTRDPSTVCFEPSTFGPSPSIHLYHIPGGARPRSMEGFLRGCCTALYESGPRPSARVQHLLPLTCTTTCIVLYVGASVCSGRRESTQDEHRIAEGRPETPSDADWIVCIPRLATGAINIA